MFRTVHPIRQPELIWSQHKSSRTKVRDRMEQINCLQDSHIAFYRSFSRLCSHCTRQSVLKRGILQQADISTITSLYSSKWWVVTLWLFHTFPGWLMMHFARNLLFTVERFRGVMGNFRHVSPMHKCRKLWPLIKDHHGMLWHNFSVTGLILLSGSFALGKVTFAKMRQQRQAIATAAATSTDPCKYHH